MENNKCFLNVLCLLSLSLTSLSCSSDDRIDSTSIQDAIAVAKSGTWYISNYIDSGENETNDYNGYDFTFNDNGTLTATNGSTTIDGIWSVTDDSSSSNDGDIDFNISFSSPPNFEELSDDWEIVSISNSKIDLIDISGGNGATDLLTFQKR